MAKFQRLFKAAASCLAVSLAVFLCAAAGAQEKQEKQEKQGKLRVAILEPTGNAAVTAMNKANVRVALQEIIVNSSGYTAVDRNRMDQILREQRFQRSSLADASGRKQLGQLIGADLICVIELLKDRGEIIINCEIINVETGEIANSAGEFLENDSNAFIRRAVGELASRMFGIETPSQVQAKQQAERERAEREAKDQEIRNKIETEARIKREMERLEREEAREKQERENPKRNEQGGSILGRLIPNLGRNTGKDAESRAEREARERSERESRERLEKETKERLEKETKERLEKETRERLERESASPDVRNAKAVINSLMPNFTFDKKGGTVSCLNNAMEQYLTEQQQLVIRKRQDYWHSLVVKIDHANGLIVHSKYVFRNNKDKLSHTQLSVFIGEEIIATNLKLTTSASNILGITTEEAEIPNPNILDIISNFPEKQVRVRIENISGVYRSYTLHPIVHRAIVETVQLYKAIAVLTQHGIEIQQRYLL